MPYSKRHSSPRTRGYFLRRVCDALRGRLFPAHAGVFPSMRRSAPGSSTLPRARGGISGSWSLYRRTWCSSPRTRGYFRDPPPVQPGSQLFPAHAGVFPTRGAHRAESLPLPRARGGISYLDLCVKQAADPSPRTRGYFHGLAASALPGHLFPAYAGVLRTGAASNQFPNAYLLPTNVSALVWI